MNVEQLIGRSASRRSTIDEDMVQRFADLISDHNPLHLNPSAARAGRFGAPVVHGMLLAGLFSGILGEELPGPGSIYLSQSVAFKRPVFVGQTVTARVVVVGADGDRGRVHLETTIATDDGALCASGEAWVLFEGT